MKKSYLLLSFVIIGVFTLLNTTTVKSKIAFPQPGSCNDPTTQVSCAQGGCHGGTNQAVTAQDLTLKIGTDTNSLVALDSTFKYAANTAYYISFQIDAPGYAFGFQSIAMDASNNPAGTFTVINSATNTLKLGYISHFNANHNTKAWKFKWTSPATTTGPITFYYAFNPGDSASFVNLVPGSNIFVGTTTIQPGFGVGINQIENNVSDLQVYPNPVNGAFSLSFAMKNENNVMAAIYSVDGKLCLPLLNEKVNAGPYNHNYNIASLSPGIYFVSLNVDGNTITKKIVKE